MNAFVKWALSRTLGEHFEFDVASVGVDSWNGFAELPPLVLKADAIDRALGSLPLRCAGGGVRRTRLTIPWSRMLRGQFDEPVIIEIIGVELKLVRLLSSTDISPAMTKEDEVGAAAMAARALSCIPDMKRAKYISGICESLHIPVQALTAPDEHLKLLVSLAHTVNIQDSGKYAEHIIGIRRK